MKATLTFDIEWWEDGQRKDYPIKESHKGALIETARDQISRRILSLDAPPPRPYGDWDIYPREGDLHDNILMDDDDPEDGVSYVGKWSVTEAIQD
jgi:hypothetical protein